MKIVINTDFGGFGLSDSAYMRYLELKGIEYETKTNKFGTVEFYKKGHLGQDNHYLSYYDIKRDSPFLVQVVEEMGEKANSKYSSLSVIEIPDNVEWIIEGYDGMEHIAEKHRIWP